MSEEQQLLASMGLLPQNAQSTDQSPYNLQNILQAMGPGSQLSGVAKTKQQEPANVAAPIMRIAAPKTPMTADTFSELIKRQTQGLQDQRKGLGQFDQQIAQINANQPSQGAQIFSALSDLVNGGDTFSKVKGAEAQGRQQVSALQQNVQKYKNDLTDKEIDLLKAQFQNERDIMKMNQEKKAAEKTLTASETEQLADLKNQVGSLENIYQDWEDKVGPASGAGDYIGSKAAGLIPNSDVSQYKANLKQKAQLIGKALEGGKLTDVDYEKYIKFLPQPGDTAETARQRVENLRKTMTSSYQNRVKTFGEAGYKTSGFSPIKDQAFASKSSGPKAGDVVDGYKFKGGDPSKPENWSK